MNKLSSYLTILLMALIAGCANYPSSVDSDKSINTQQAMPYYSDLHDAFIDIYNVWQGVPYRLGGSSIDGIDCSAFVQIAFQDATNIALPRTTQQQITIGREIKYDQVRVGDLVFFKTSPNVRHVGIYMGSRKFIHASTSKGVIISRVDSPYWASKFWHFRRVITPPEIK